MAAFLSGEMRDTVEVNPAASYMLEKMFSRKERAGLFQSWAGRSVVSLVLLCAQLGRPDVYSLNFDDSASMWLKGGNAIWGDAEGAPDDPGNATDTRAFSSHRLRS